MFARAPRRARQSDAMRTDPGLDHSRKAVTARARIRANALAEQSMLDRADQLRRAALARHRATLDDTLDPLDGRP